MILSRELLHLSRALAKLRAARSRADIVAADLALHLAIADLSGNRALKVILMSLVDVISIEITGRTRGEGPHRRQSTLRDHEDIVQSIVAGDPGDARSKMAHHFDVALSSFAGWR